MFYTKVLQLVMFEKSHKRTRSLVFPFSMNPMKQEHLSVKGQKKQLKFTQSIVPHLPSERRNLFFFLI